MSRKQRAFKSLWSKPDAPMSLGCIDCPERATCGGQTVDGSSYSCLDQCCGKPETCQIVCTDAHIYPDRIREVKGLDLETPSGPLHLLPTLPRYLPMMFHGSALEKAVDTAMVAIPLYRFFDRNGTCRFEDMAAVRSTFKLGPNTQIVLSGVAQDHEVERWWKLEQAGRAKAIAQLRHLGIALVTTPNFSLIVDRPRWDDLHSMRRIVLAYHELISQGQPAALHVNGRTQKDFERWGTYIANHSEVTHIAYEFTTGTRNPRRMMQHANWLSELASASTRRLGLLLRGGSMVSGLLADHFDVTFIDSSPFGKAQHREVACLDERGQRRWAKRPTLRGQPVNALLEENIRVSRFWFEANLPKARLAA
ncbi:protein of unknown function [Sphingobium sp. YR657]|uniref:DUF4417 domain-containing protein n=1 Tax=Sphingobium sp. YR657 TaxID=1884366 RepID=UPI00091710DC|nr:DUF4417 domain-containing protein [Sphingobium sp. YR657]SHM66763.1 protein of unknown function [Sphingobium sp. YR657]